MSKVTKRKVLKEPKLGPTQFAAEVERLKAEGKMPSLEQLLDVIAETRKILPPGEDEDEDEQPGPLDCVTKSLIANGVPLTQRNWIEFAYPGDKSSIDQLEGEELADLPEGFENWPEDELPVN
jgi:hypothetical protein